MRAGAGLTILAVLTRLALSRLPFARALAGTLSWLLASWLLASGSGLSLGVAGLFAGRALLLLLLAARHRLALLIALLLCLGHLLIVWGLLPRRQ